jgi:hypothetical protein
MTTFAELAERQPRLMNHRWAVTEGRDAKRTLVLRDKSTGVPIDLSGVTFTCTVLTDVDGSTVFSPTVTGNSSGELVITVADGDTAGKAVGGTRSEPRQCIWFCYGVKGTDKVQLWGPAMSTFKLWAE